jgi:hypothetical protein
VSLLLATHSTGATTTTIQNNYHRKMNQSREAAAPENSPHMMMNFDRV